MVIPLFLGYIVKKMPWATLLLIIINVVYFSLNKSDLSLTEDEMKIKIEQYQANTLTEKAFLERCTKDFDQLTCQNHLKGGGPSSLPVADIDPSQLQKENNSILHIIWASFKVRFEQTRHYYDREKMFFEVSKLNETTKTYLKSEVDKAQLEKLTADILAIHKKYNWFSKMNVGFVSLTKALFTHSDLMHLLSNMLFLFILGMYVEAKLGSVVFGLLYLAIGVFSSLLAAHFENPLRFTVGASGAIFGVTSLYYSLFFKDYLKLKIFLFAASRNIFLKNSIWFPLIFMLTEFAQGVGGEYWHENGVSHICHAAGLISGFAIGFLFEKHLQEDIPHGFHFTYQVQNWIQKINSKNLETMLMEVKAQLLNNPNNFTIRESFLKRYFADERHFKNPYHQILVYTLGKELLVHYFETKNYAKLSWLVQNFLQNGALDEVIASIDANHTLYIGDSLVKIKKFNEAQHFYDTYLKTYQQSKITEQVKETVRRVRSKIVPAEPPKQEVA